MIAHPNAKVIICGDFNLMPIDGLVTQFQLSKKVQFATRGASCLDQILTDVDQYQPAEELPPLIQNEQDPCCIYLPGKNIAKHQYRETYVRHISAESKTQVLIDIAKQDWGNVINCLSVDEMVGNYYDTIESILNKHCPFRRKKLRVDNSFTLTPLISKLIKARDREYRQRKKSIKWKFFSKMIQRLIIKAKRSYASQKLNKAVASKAWWKEIDKIDGKHQKKTAEKFMVDGSWLNAAEFSERLNTFFSQVGGNRENIFSSCANFPTALQPVSIGEVKHLLKKLNTGKATHGNDIPTWVSKVAADDLCVPLTTIINKMLETQEYPEIWKNSQIRPLKKTTNPSGPGDYRPIALLHHLGKLAEEIILQKLKSTVEAKLNINQFAYRKQHCTTDALLKLVDSWCSSLDNPTTSHISAVLIDMSKAFDRLHPDFLRLKLQNLNVNDSLIHLIDSFLTGRSCTVRIGQHQSSKKRVTMGTPQGTKLGPWLWLVYVNDLLPDCPTIKYADDVTTYQLVRKTEPDATQKNLQMSLDYISEWATANNMLLNSTKTQLIKFTLSEPKVADQYSLSNRSITESPQSKLLGVTFDHRLTPTT